jgi:hypothetical protein
MVSCICPASEITPKKKIRLFYKTTQACTLMLDIHTTFTNLQVDAPH